jgi:hypothetical protein
MSFWEVVGTQTVVAKESHLARGEYNPDNLYSVTTTERFVAIDLRRATDTPNLAKIRQVEREYFQLCAELGNLGCSPLDNYASPTAMDINWKTVLILLLLFWPALIWYFYSKNKKLKQAVTSWQSRKPRLDGLLQDNRSILNLPG